MPNYQVVFKLPLLVMDAKNKKEGYEKLKEIFLQSSTFSQAELEKFISLQREPTEVLTEEQAIKYMKAKGLSDKSIKKFLKDSKL